MAHIIRVRSYDPKFRGFVTTVSRRGFFGTKLLYKYVVCMVRFEIPGIYNSENYSPAIPEMCSRYEDKWFFSFLWNYKQPNLPDLKPEDLWNT